MDTLKQMSFDAIVVGSGPGGAAVTRELSRYGRRVLILERGSEEPIEGTVRQCASMAMVPGKSLLVTRQCLALIRGITYGGSSVLAYACAFDPPYEIFDSHGVDLRAEVERLKQELPIAPLADELFGPAARRIMESARALGYAWNRLPKIVYQENCRPECDKCTVGCPHAAKWTARLFIDEALESGSVLVTGAHVKSVLIRNGTATGVSFTKSGREHRVSAPVIVLAAGGIGTPLILRQSGVAGAGYDFFFDPLIIAMGTVDERHKGKEFPMAAGYRDEADGYLMTDLVWPRWTFRLFAIEVLRFHRLGSHGRMLPIMARGCCEALVALRRSCTMQVLVGYSRPGSSPHIPAVPLRSATWSIRISGPSSTGSMCVTVLSFLNLGGYRPC
jgi:hypothetical protein